MAQTVSLSATAREKTGKGAARQARFQKQVPAVIYGHGRTTQTLMVDALALVVQERLALDPLSGALL